MIKISKEDYKLRLTKRDEINIDDMNDSQLALYLSIYSVYMEWFTNLLILNTNIKDFDDKLKKSDLKFTKVGKKDLDFYQNFSAQYLDYFYLRNNLYLYRLNKDEYEFIVDRIKKDNYTFDDEVENFILKTYKKVIYEKVKGVDIAKVSHDREDLGRYVINTALLIGLRYDISNELKDKEWYDNLLMQERFVNNISNLLIEDINKYFNNPVALLKFK